MVVPGVQLQNPLAGGSTTFLVQPSATTVSATGGTIHHLGQSPTRTTALASSALASVLVSPNPSQHQQSPTIMNAQHLQGLVSQLAQQQQQQTMPSKGTSSTSGATSSAALNSSPARSRKRAQLDTKPAPDAETAKLRRLVLEDRISNLRQTRDKYVESVAELNYLELGFNYNFSEYNEWRKNPNADLQKLLKSAKAAIGDDDIPEAVIINNEVSNQTFLFCLMCRE